MRVAKIFQNGQSQAVRLPKEFRFEGNEVYIKKMGAGVVLIPMQHGWNAMKQSLDKFSEDFMETREQPSVQKREDF